MSKPFDDGDDAAKVVSDEKQLAATPVVVRRNAALAALVGAGASAIAIAYLWRASQSGLLLDWGLCAVLACLAAYYLASLVDSRTPLLVADDLGVRIRLGNEWRGLPWDAIRQVVVAERRGVLHDGRLVLAPRSIGHALDGLDGRGRRQAAVNQKTYGAALAVPVGIATRISTHAGAGVVDQLNALARGRAEIVPGAPEPVAPGPVAREPVAREPVEPEPVEPGPVAPEPVAPGQPRRTLLGGIGTVVSRVAKGRDHDVDVEPAPPVLDPSLAPLRTARRASRAEVTRDLPATLGNAALQTSAAERDGRGALPEGRELRRPGSVDLVFESADRPEATRVRPIARLGDSVEPLVIDDFVTEPAYDPVIGPELTAARTRLGLSVDDLAERTRIRPHVIESIEVDDFAPCGGDFYARGHLRTLGRVLGKDVDALVESFDKRYATAPINARRVFEAELATGMTGSMRSTIGGPNWGLMIGVVLTLVLVWGVVRLFAGAPAELVSTPAPVLNGSVATRHAYPDAGPVAPVKKPLTVGLVAAHAASHVVVRDGAGEVVYTADLVLGEKKRLEVTPPVDVRAADAGAIEVQIEGKERGVVGEPGKHGRRTFGKPAR